MHERQTNGRENCFNLRLMWRCVHLRDSMTAYPLYSSAFFRRQNSLGKLYAYILLTDNNRKELLAVPPPSIANPDFGFSVGRGSFRFRTAATTSNNDNTSFDPHPEPHSHQEGGWNLIWERVRLNTIGQEDGTLRSRRN